MRHWPTSTPAGRLRLTRPCEGLERAPDLKIHVDAGVSENGAC